MRAFDNATRELDKYSRQWLVTGVGGFIGSNLLEFLLAHGQDVVGLDDFSTGHRHNLDKVRDAVGKQYWPRFRLVEGDIRNLAHCREACRGCQVVLHQAALGSVPRSLQDPLTTNQVNIDGFLNMLVAARDEAVDAFVYAASSSTYGDHPDLPKVESEIGNPLSPYAVTKYVNELYADVFARSYGFRSIGLRYFNVFGRRQDPAGAYAAVMPRWIAAMLRGERIQINGKGDTSRDFCFIDNAVEANILAALTTNPKARGQVFNVALDDQTTLNELYSLIRELLEQRIEGIDIQEPEYRDYRAGDVKHSRASIDKARQLIGYDPLYRVKEGLELAMDWYIQDLES